MKYDIAPLDLEEGRLGLLWGDKAGHDPATSHAGPTDPSAGRERLGLLPAPLPGLPLASDQRDTDLKT